MGIHVQHYSHTTHLKSCQGSTIPLKALGIVLIGRTQEGPCYPNN